MNTGYITSPIESSAGLPVRTKLTDLKAEIALDLVQQIALKGQIAGISLFEVRPERDVNALTASTAAQLIINFIGTITRH